MTEAEARALATKREAHKSKHLSHKNWTAVNDPEKGWTVKLTESPFHADLRAAEARERARMALETGNLQSFLDAASDALIARAQADIAREQQKG